MAAGHDGDDHMMEHVSHTHRLKKVSKTVSNQDNTYIIFPFDKKDFYCFFLKGQTCHLVFRSLFSTSRVREALWCRSSSRLCSTVQENWGSSGRESRACWELSTLASA